MSLRIIVILHSAREKCPLLSDITSIDIVYSVGYHIMTTVHFSSRFIALFIITIPRLLYYIYFRKIPVPRAFYGNKDHKIPNIYLHCFEHF